MNKLDLIKAGAEIVVSFGVGAIVGNAVVLTTPANTKAITKLCIKVGSLALSGMAGDAATAYVGAAIDNAAEKIKDLFDKEDPIQENGEIETA